MIGWLAHQSGESDVGISYLERALAVAPDHPDAVFFLAIVRIDTGDTAEAIKLLELMLSWDDLTDEFRAQISQTLSQARAS